MHPCRLHSSHPYVSESSIIRLTRKLGCKGYSDLKLRLARELDSLSGDLPIVSVDTPVSAGATSEQICSSMYALSLQALRDTRESIDTGCIEDAARLLHDSDLIHVFGGGESLVLASDFHYKLLRVGIRSTLNMAEGFQEVYSIGGAKAREIRECALVVSEYCKSERLDHIIEELREARIPYVLLTAARNPWPYDRYAKVVLRYYSWSWFAQRRSPCCSSR